MNVKETTKMILSLPRKYKEIFTISIYDLLKQTGYFEIHDKVLAKDIQILLTQHPEFIEDWIQYSADKRCTTGWYFKLGDGRKYLVGCLKKNGNNQTAYDDKIEACSVFIKHEVDEIKNS